MYIINEGLYKNVNDEEGCEEIYEEEEVIEETSEEIIATETTTKSDTTNWFGLQSSTVW